MCQPLQILPHKRRRVGSGIARRFVTTAFSRL
jgi:hypothetical protein